MEVTEKKMQHCGECITW